MRRVAFWGAFAGAVLGARWVAQQRPVNRSAAENPTIDRETAQAYLWITGFPQFRVLYSWLARRALWKVPATGQALDIGCGPGRLLVELARREPDLELVGLDVSAEMLELATTQTAPFGSRVHLQQGDAEQLPFPDGSFDLVVSTLALHEFKNPVAVFQGVARVLRPGGRFLLFDFRRDVVRVAWLGLWLAHHTVVPRALRSAGEPLASVRASYTPREVAELASQVPLPPWRVGVGPVWLSLENATAP